MIRPEFETAVTEQLHTERNIGKVEVCKRNGGMETPTLHQKETLLIEILSQKLRMLSGAVSSIRDRLLAIWFGNKNGKS